MGEIADMLINGDMDFYTGEYIGRGKGIPRTLDKSLPWEQKKSNPSFGVTNFLYKRGVRRPDQIDLVLRTYAEHKKWEIQGKKFVRKVSAKIQENFQDFASWCGRYIKPENNPI